VTIKYCDLCCKNLSEAPHGVEMKSRNDGSFQYDLCIGCWRKLIDMLKSGAWKDVLV